MKKIVEQDLKVGASLTDVNIQMGLTQSLSVVQDNMCEYFKQLGCDGLTMIPVCNCFFVVTKTKIKFNRFLTWLDEFKVKSEVTGKSRIKVFLNSDITDRSGVVSSCLQEMVPMDADKRSLRMIDTTLFPADLECSGSTDIEFAKMNFDLSDECLRKEMRVEVVNLDFYRHTNNVEYVRIMLSCLDLDFFDNVIIEDFEIHYLSESRYNSPLKVYVEDANNSVRFEIRKDDQAIIKAVLNYRYK